MGETVIGTGGRLTGAKRIFHEFRREPVTSKRLGGAVTGAAGDRNNMLLSSNGFDQPGLGLEWIVLGTQTILQPSLGTNGLDIGMDQTDNDGIELTMGITARGPFAFVVGTDKPFFIEVKMITADVSGCDPFLVGFHKAEAYQAAFDNYDEAAWIGFVADGSIKTETILNNAATVETDTTMDGVDATAITFRVNVGADGTCTYLVNGAAPTAIAATAMKFDVGEVVVPDIYFLHGSDVAGSVELIHLDVGYQ